MKNIINIVHVTTKVTSTFENFTYNIEECLGLMRPADLDFLHGDNASLAGLLENLGGEQDLIIFNIIEHGELLRLNGHSGKAKQYQVGNPNMAIRMTTQNISAGLYAPLRILVFENTDGETIVEYDLPSSVFSQYKDEKIDTVSALMDKKLENLIEMGQRTC